MSDALEQIQEARPRRFRPYPEYKDSGVEWLGEIPAHWETVRVMDHATLINGYPFDSAHFTLAEGMPLVRIRDLDSSNTEVQFAGAPVDAALIRKADILIGMDGEFNVGRWKGEDALLNQRMCCLRPRDSIDGQFLHYNLPLPLKFINDVTYSTTVKHLSSFDVKKIRFAYPPTDEQRAIAAFLDRESAKIDGLVARKERLIELLQEKRTALITRAVTRGLDPDVPMKDSGVEWLGEIPAGWEVKRWRYCCKVTEGLVDPTDDAYADRVMIAPNHVESGTGRILFIETAEEQGAISGKYIVDAGDLIYSKIRPALNKVCVADGDWLCSADMYPV